MPGVPLGTSAPPPQCFDSPPRYCLKVLTRSGKKKMCVPPQLPTITDKPERAKFALNALTLHVCKEPTWLFTQHAVSTLITPPKTQKRMPSAVHDLHSIRSQS